MNALISESLKPLIDVYREEISKLSGLVAGITTAWHNRKAGGLANNDPLSAVLSYALRIDILLLPYMAMLLMMSGVALLMSLVVKATLLAVTSGLGILNS